MVTKVKQNVTLPIPQPDVVEEPIEQVKLEPAPGRLTLETFLYTMILSLGLILRLWALGHYPLSDIEAQQSLIALHLAQAETPAIDTGYSPLLVSLTSLAFFLFYQTDTAARLAPLLLGMGLVVLPLAFRRQLGSVTCLLASALLALSPTALFLSRTLNSEIGVAAGALMMVAGFFNWIEDGAKRWLFLLASGAAVLLTAGPMAYSMIVVLAVIILIRLPAFRALWTERATATDRQELRQAGLFFVVALFLLSTAATFNLSGFSVTTGLLSEWLGRFTFEPRVDSGFNAVFLLTIYELLIVIAGLVGLTFVLLKGDLLRFVFAGWFAGAIILDLAMAGRPVGNVILALVPLAFLAALALAELWEGLQNWGSWSNEGLILASGLVISAFGYIGLTGWLARSCGPDDRFCQLAWLQSIAALALLLIIVIFFWLMNGPGIALRGLALTGVVLGLLIAINIGSRLNYGPLMNLAYQPLAALPASPRLLDLRETLTSQAMIRTGDETLLDLTLLTTTPALEWQLRDFENLSQAGSLAETGPTSAMITPMANQDELDLGEAYLGQDFALNLVWSPVGLPAKALLSWLIYRELNQLPTTGDPIIQPPQPGDSIILWLRTDRS